MSSESELVKQRELKRAQYLIELRDALKKDNVGEFDDSFLLKFLRAKVFDVDQTFAMIKNYVELFKKFPQFFQGVDYSKDAVEGGIFQLFPHRNVTGERIANLCPGNWEPSKVPFESIVASTVYGFEVAEIEEQTQLCGAVEIVDCVNVGMKQFVKIGIAQLRLMSNMTENTLPIRWRKLFVCNQNNLIDILYKMVKPFLSKEFKERVIFLGQDFTKMHADIPRELLPIKYGGTWDKLDPKLFFKELKIKEPQLLKLWEPFKQS